MLLTATTVVVHATQLAAGLSAPITELRPADVMQDAADSSDTMTGELTVSARSPCSCSLSTCQGNKSLEFVIGQVTDKALQVQLCRHTVLQHTWKKAMHTKQLLHIS